jgi:hypothetical protein
MEFTDKAVEKKVKETIDNAEDQAYTPLTLRKKLVDEGVPNEQATRVILGMVETSKISYYFNRRLGR